MRIRTIAKRLPKPIKNTLKAAYGAIPPRLRLGRVFWETYDFLQESQWWDAARLQAYQMRQLELLLAHCYEHVPYYRRTFDEWGLKPSQIQSPADLQRLPYLRKEQIRKEPQAFLARNRRHDRLEYRYTTGTSGQPLQFPVDYEELEREWAFAFHQWSRVGYVPGDARAEVRGPRIPGSRPCEWDPVIRVLRLSPVVNDKETVQFYLDMIRSMGIRFLYGYPSSLTYLASLVNRYKLDVHLRLTALLFASETLYPWQRTLVEQVFGCRSYNFYGLAEHVVIGGECESSPSFHCMPQYGITEIDPRTGEVTGTGFLNYAHPFVRYKTADVATQPTGSGCPRCGRNYFPVLADVEGRLQDFVLTPEGVPICSCVMTFPFKQRRTIGRVQIVQETLDRVILRSAPVGEATAQYEAELAEAHAGLQHILGEGVTIRREAIPSEECMGPGKLRFILSHLPREIRCYDGNREP
ncbi:MAG: phenylacetate--CoA ligase family protein [Solirubrobacterales bacterium]